MRAMVLMMLVVVLGCDGTPPAAAPDGSAAFDDAGQVDEGGVDAGRTVQLRGGVQKGPFVLGSAVGISPVNSSGSPTGALFNTTTLNDLGDFAIDFTYLGPVSLEATGYYYNEATGELSLAPLTLRAYHEVSSGGAQSAYVNLLTHLTYGRVRELIGGGASVFAAAAQAEGELRTELGIGPPAFTPDAPAIFLNVFGGDTDSSAYLLAVSSVLAQVGLARGGDLGADSALQELLARIAADLAPDGLIADTLKAEIATAYRSIDGDRIMSQFRIRLEAIGSSEVVPDIHRMLDTDADGVVNANDNCRADPNPLQENRDADAWGDACDYDTLSSIAGWHTADRAGIGVAWGDVDGDGDLDLATSGGTAVSGLFRNEGGTLTARSVWTPPDASEMELAWGDVDGDGDLDLAAAGDQIRLYRNDAGILTTASAWRSTDSANSQSVAWGDVDDDGDLDLAVAQQTIGYRVYRNNAGRLTTTATWASTEGTGNGTVAWGDVDGDGDLDLAGGDLHSILYRNDGGTLTSVAVWRSADADVGTYGHAVAWGDVDGDGDLDLATGSNLYRNDAGTLTAAAVWSATGVNYSGSQNPVALADIDGDGDIDLVNVDDVLRPNLHRNDGGALTAAPVWTGSTTSYGTSSVALGDVDRDGDLDLAVGAYFGVELDLNTLR